MPNVTSDGNENAVPMRAFDGYPYLVTYFVPAFFHIILLPLGLPRSRLEEFASRQARINGLPTCLVLGANECVYYSDKDGSRSSTMTTPPAASFWSAFRLMPVEVFPETEELARRRGRLVDFLTATNVEGFITGDITKRGRAPAPGDLERLEGHGSDGVRRGLARCGECGEFAGECLDSLPGVDRIVVTVHCRCAAQNRCGGCGELLAAWKLSSNRYDERLDTVWHQGALVALGHRCTVVSQADLGPDDLKQDPLRRFYSIDVERMAEVARVERNLVAAFNAAIRVSPDLWEALEDDREAYSRLGFLDENNGYELEPGVTTPDAGEVFAFLGLQQTPLLQFEWDGFGPCSSCSAYSAVQNLGSFDFVYQWSEVEGYPVVFAQPHGAEPLSTMLPRVMYGEIVGPELASLPSRIVNYDEGLLSPLWLRQAVFDAVEARDGWHELRDSIVNELAYPDHLQRSITLLREAVHGPVREDGLDTEEDDAEGEVTLNEKLRLVDTYLSKAYWTAEALQARIDAARKGRGQ